MTGTWLDYLRDQGAHIDNDRVESWPQGNGLAALQSGTVMADLSHIALYNIEGKDAQEFLSGQFSNDIRLLDEKSSQLSAYCNPKGRMLALFRLNLTDNGYLAQIDRGIAGQVIPRLKMYVLRSEVTIEPAPVVSIGLAGPGAIKAVESATGCTAPDAVNGMTRNGAIMVIRLAGDHRLQVIAPAERMQAIWQQLSETLTPVGWREWEWTEIHNGIPCVRDTTYEQFIPQMVNLDLLHGINFKKGCYPGQEIVARMKYLGKLKQRMLGGHIDSDTPPEPGTSVYAASFGENSAGTVVNAQPSPEGGCDLLVVAQIKSLESNDLHVSTIDGAAISLKPLPYSVPMSGETADSA